MSTPDDASSSPAADVSIAAPTTSPTVIYDRQWPLVAGSSLSPSFSSLAASSSSALWSPIHHQVASQMLSSILVESDTTPNHSTEYTTLSGTVIRRWPSNEINDVTWTDQAMEHSSWKRLPCVEMQHNDQHERLTITVAERCACAMGIDTKRFKEICTATSSPMVPYLNEFVV